MDCDMSAIVTLHTDGDYCHQGAVLGRLILEMFRSRSLHAIACNRRVPLNAIALNRGFKPDPEHTRVSCPRFAWKLDSRCTFLPYGRVQT